MDFNHGVAIAKFDIGDVIKKGEQGILTAYLPEMERFAVMFDNNRWYTFSETLEIFLEKFETIIDLD